MQLSEEENDDRPLTDTVTVSPPLREPLPGDTPVTCTLDTYSNCTVLDEKSMPFKVTEIDTIPLDIAGVTHTTSVELTYCAGTDSRSNLHDSSRVNTKPLPVNTT